MNIPDVDHSLQILLDFANTIKQHNINGCIWYFLFKVELVLYVTAATILHQCHKYDICDIISLEFSDIFLMQVECCSTCLVFHITHYTLYVYKYT